MVSVWRKYETGWMSWNNYPSCSWWHLRVPVSRGQIDAVSPLPVPKTLRWLSSVPTPDEAGCLRMAKLEIDSSELTCLGQGWGICVGDMSLKAQNICSRKWFFSIKGHRLLPLQILENGRDSLQKNTYEHLHTLMCAQMQTCTYNILHRHVDIWFWRNFQYF